MAPHRGARSKSGGGLSTRMREGGTVAAMHSSEALLAEQANVLEQIVRGAPLEAVLAALCRIVESHAHDGRVHAAISLVDPDGRRLRTAAAPSLPDDYNRAIDGLVI